VQGVDCSTGGSRQRGSRQKGCTGKGQAMTNNVIWYYWDVSGPQDICNVRQRPACSSCG
jgi:hypothetical protein